MRIIDATLHPYRLKLKRPWVTAKGKISRREGLLVAVHDNSGTTGWGDCAPLRTAGTESHPESARMLGEFIRQLPGREPNVALDGLNGLPPAARCGMETALLDLQARSSAITLAELLGGQHRDSLHVNAACGDLNKDTASCVAAAIEAGFRIIKFKVGLLAPKQEADLLRTLARHAGRGIAFRLDANGAWNPRQAQSFIAAIEGLPVESLEEPLTHPDPVELESLQGRCPFPLALDESLAGLDPASIPDLPPVRRLVLKPTVLGGPRATLAWSRIAYDAGMEAVLTSTLESAVGIAMAAQVAATLEMKAVHGLTTGLWFESDTASLPPVVAGKLPLPRGKGIGLEPAIP
jgi:o-succinylbenzoate synthase